MRFKNKFDSSGAVTFLDIMKWQLFKSRKWSKSISSLEMKKDAKLLKSKEDFICWLGHSSFLIQLDNKRFLLDPVFGNIPFYKRQFKAPYTIKELGGVDYVLLSHIHYDHFDKSSIKSILSKKAEFILPLNMKYYINKIDKNIVSHSLNWYKSYAINHKLKVSFVPSKHWGRRGLFDTNKALWGGYVISSKKHTIYFAGDTAYDEHFKTIGKKYNIDYALLPIGGYAPIKIMRENHLNPKEAYEAFKDLNAKVMIPMHYGTFKLSDEPINEPIKWLELLIKKSENKIYKMKVGEVTFMNAT